MARRKANVDKMVQTGIAAWLLPGGGHFLLGQRGLGLVFFSAITFAYVGGLVLGGVKNSVNPLSNSWLFLGEMGAGGYTVGAYLINLSFGELSPADLASPTRREQIPPEVYAKYVSFYPAADVAQIYLATGGLLNLLAILDALTRAQTGGLPTYYRELRSENGGAG